MSKTKRKYNREEDYGNDEAPIKNDKQKIREKRFRNALKQKNIAQILELEEVEEDWVLDLEEHEAKIEEERMKNG